MSALRLAQHAGYIFIVRTAMTPIQVDLVQQSFRRIALMPSEASRIFYNEFFRLAPDARALFPEEMSRQKEKFVRTLEVLVKSLDRISDVSDEIVDLGRRHMAYDIDDEHFEAFGKALLRVVEKILGNAMTQEIGNAWTAAQTMVTTIMREVAGEPCEPGSFYAHVIRDAMTAHYGLTPRPEKRRMRPSITEEARRELAH